MKGVIFKQFSLKESVYKSESLGLGEGIIIQLETDQLVEDFSLVGKPAIASLSLSARAYRRISKRKRK